MNDFIALSIIRTTSGAGLARSAMPSAAIRPARRGLRRSVASTLRTTAALEHRWAERLDPVAC